MSLPTTIPKCILVKCNGQLEREIIFVPKTHGIYASVKNGDGSPNQWFQNLRIAPKEFQERLKNILFVFRSFKSNTVESDGVSEISAEMLESWKKLPLP